MRLDPPPPLATATTLGLGGPPTRFVVADSAAEAVAATREAADSPLLFLGGGSNLVVADAGWDGTVVALRWQGISPRRDGDRVEVTVQAGHEWDAAVAETVAAGWSGLECLSGIPGRAGATPIQNVGAYGQEIAQVVVSVLVWDRERSRQRELTAAECGFAYRGSIFKRSSRYLVLAVTFALIARATSVPLRYGELARRLGCEPGGSAPLEQVRQAVLELRRGKGMVVDVGDRDSWSVGSFFVNPVLDAEGFDRFRRALPAGAEFPHWPEPDGAVKLSAAWLIERAGFPRGYRRGAAGISTKHTLALTNAAGTSTAELLALAREVRDGVRERFGVTLWPEPTFVGVDW